MHVAPRTKTTTLLLALEVNRLVTSNPCDKAKLLNLCFAGLDSDVIRIRVIRELQSISNENGFYFGSTRCSEMPILNLDLYTERLANCLGLSSRYWICPQCAIRNRQQRITPILNRR